MGTKYFEFSPSPFAFWQEINYTVLNNCKTRSKALCKAEIRGENMELLIKKQPYRFPDGLLEAQTDLVEDLEAALLSSVSDLPLLSRAYYNDLLRVILKKSGWDNNPSVFNQIINPFAPIEYVKKQVGLEVGFRHASFIGHNLIKFELSPKHNSDFIEMGIFVVTTLNFQKQIKKNYSHNWAGAISFEKVDRYLRHFKHTFQNPIYLLGIDVA